MGIHGNERTARWPDDLPVFAKTAQQKREISIVVTVGGDECKRKQSSPYAHVHLSIGKHRALPTHPAWGKQASASLLTEGRNVTTRSNATH